MRVMIVDDHGTNRELCRFILAHIASHIDTFEDGQQAIDAMRAMEILPDVILLDVMMPIKDGFVTAKEIRQAFVKHHIPIIFLTVLDDRDSFEKCLALGDDFILKPVERSVLIAKVQAHYRIVKMHNEVMEQRDELRHFREQVQYDYAISESIFTNLMEEMCHQVEHIFGIHYISTASTIFNGDLIVVANRPHGGVYVMIADATGHGLPAAISTIPATRTFFSTAQKGLSLGEMVVELNHSLERFLPIGMMLAASVFEVRANGFEVSWWGGGLPEAYLLDNHGKIVSRLISNHMPLGVLFSNEFEADVQHFKLEPNQKLVCYTDGIIESMNEQGEYFGQERLEQVLTQAYSEALIPTLYDAVKKFSNRGKGDDLSILTMTFPITNSNSSDKALPKVVLSCIPLQTELHFPADVLRKISLMNEVRRFLTGIVSGGEDLDLLCSVLSELFANAIEHGLLELDSSLKETPDGFFEFYQLRDKRLKTLPEYHWLILKVNYQPENQRIEIDLEHSGKGFDCQALKDASNQKSYGRGILLATQLCESLEYSNQGRRVTAVYSFARKDTLQYSLPS